MSHLVLEIMIIKINDDENHGKVKNYFIYFLYRKTVTFVVLKVTNTKFMIRKSIKNGVFYLILLLSHKC